MTKLAFIRQADLKRMAAIARSEGVRVEVEKDGIIIRVLPDVDRPEPSKWHAPLSAADTGRGDEAPVRTGENGYPVPDDPNHPLQQWYDSLGFDPRTMDRADMKRLMQIADEKWAAEIPGTPLGKREVIALEQFAKHGPNHRIHFRDVKSCGPDTGDRLKARGFIQTFPNETFPERVGSFMLTDAGYEAWMAYQSGG